MSWHPGEDDYSVSSYVRIHAQICRENLEFRTTETFTIVARKQRMGWVTVCGSASHSRHCGI